MTASVTVTVPSAATATGPRPTGASEPRDGAGSGAPKDFDSQLHAARQQHDARGTDDASNNRDDRRDMPATPPSSDRQPEAARPADPGTVPAAVPVAAPAIETVVAAAPAPADRNEPDDQPASAMAGAMLALLGSSVAAALQPVEGNGGAAAGALVQAGTTLASDARAAAVLQLAGAGTSAASLPAGMVPLAANVPMMVDAALPAPSAVGKDAAEGHGLAMTLPAPPAAATAPAPPHQLQLPSPLGSQSFAQDLGQQVAWLGGQNIKQARIRLHPEELGSLDVSVSVTHGRVDVVFSAQHAAAIPAVQQSLPQLDQMLARHGLSLGHAEVGQRDRGDRRGHAGHAGAIAVDEIADVHGGMPVALGKVGLLDAFA